MRRLIVLIIALLLSILASATTLFIIDRPIGVYEYPIYLEITDEQVLGFNVDSTNLTFSRVPLGSQSERWIDVNVSTNAIAYVSLSGPASEFITHDNYVRLYPQNTTQISFLATIAASESVATYEGTAKIVLKKR